MDINIFINMKNIIFVNLQATKEPEEVPHIDQNKKIHISEHIARPSGAIHQMIELCNTSGIPPLRTRPAVSRLKNAT
jgi:hypothetical protein